VFNFQHGFSLANFQDSIFSKIIENKEISKSEKQRIYDNLWVKIAFFIAPNNLVVRHLCLHDLASKSKDHLQMIEIQLEALTYKLQSKNGLWAEGYSYWLYTKRFLKFYADFFGSEVLNKYIQNIDKSFCQSAYLRQSILYPAPFGDLRDIPLEDDLQNPQLVEKFCNFFPVNKSSDTYFISGSFSGLNTHTQRDNINIIIENGYPKNFKFYLGYDKKYKNKFHEICDIISLIWRLLLE